MKVARLVGPVVALALTACPGDGAHPSPTPTPTAPLTAPTSTATATAPAAGACGEVTFPPRQEGGHLLAGNDPPVPWSSTPGTSGWHAGGAPRTGVIPASEPLSEAQIVLALEIGQAVAAYDAARLPDADLATLTRLANTVHAGSLTVTPFDGAALEHPLVLLAWGTLQGCDRVDGGAVADMVARAAAESPGGD